MRSFGHSGREGLVETAESEREKLSKFDCCNNSAIAELLQQLGGAEMGNIYYKISIRVSI